MSTCLGKMMMVEEVELAPQLKKMKLSSGDAGLDYEIARSSLIESDYHKEMKFVFPYLNEDVILFTYIFTLFTYLFRKLKIS